MDEISFIGPQLVLPMVWNQARRRRLPNKGIGFHAYDSIMATYSNENSLVAVFDNVSDANDATDRLRAAGLPPGKLTLLSGASAIAFAQRNQGGFWNEIAAFFRDEEERRDLLKELAHGGCLLVLTDLDLDEDDVALDILDDE
ncbi:hypothetical protein AB4Z52_35055 [Rhizobium sp. 2YAF20]|uniref:hypothetical protein n=1 Tax=Rhizobium sp. 2YAF20 TaxID=3233027 RepID=UPI003F97196E